MKKKRKIYYIYSRHDHQLHNQPPNEKPRQPTTLPGDSSTTRPVTQTRHHQQHWLKKTYPDPSGGAISPCWTPQRCPRSSSHTRDRLRATQRWHKHNPQVLPPLHHHHQESDTKPSPSPPPLIHQSSSFPHYDNAHHQTILFQKQVLLKSYFFSSTRKCIFTPALSYLLICRVTLLTSSYTH